MATGRHAEIYQEFEKACLEQFAFLCADYAFRQEPIIADATEASVLFRNSEIAVSVRYEPLDNVVIIFLVGMVGGVVPPYSVSTWHNLDGVLSRQGLSSIKQPNYGYPFSNSKIDFQRILAAYAVPLRHCLDMFRAGERIW